MLWGHIGSVSWRHFQWVPITNVVETKNVVPITNVLEKEREHHLYNMDEFCKMENAKNTIFTCTFLYCIIHAYEPT